jgi:hypothetical protein
MSTRSLSSLVPWKYQGEKPCDKIQQQQQQQQKQNNNNNNIFYPEFNLPVTKKF